MYLNIPTDQNFDVTNVLTDERMDFLHNLLHKYENKGMSRFLAIGKIAEEEIPEGDHVQLVWLCMQAGLCESQKMRSRKGITILSVGVNNRNRGTSEEFWNPGQA